VELEVAGTLGEVHLRRRLDPDRGAPVDRSEGNRVEVLAEDPPLRAALLELRGQLGLADLALEGAFGILDVERASELLGDRRAALHRLPGADVLDAGAHDRPVVDALVGPEVLVLDGDERVAHVLGHLTPPHRCADLVGLDVAEPRAVGGEDHRALALVDGAELVQVRSGRSHRGDVSDDAEQTDGGQRPDHG